MPGIAGFMPITPKPDRQATLERMARPMRYTPGQSVTHESSGQFAAVVVDYGEGFEFLRPAAARNEDVLLVMEGEVFPESHETPSDMRSRGTMIQRAEFCLRQYMQDGPSFAERLNGAFAIAVWDGRDSKLHLFTDRCLSRPLYYRAKGGQFAFATSVRSLLKFSDEVGRQYDMMSLAELFALERVVSERTLFTDIQSLGPACHAVWDGRKLSKTRYHDPQATAPTAAKSWKEASATLLELLRNAVRRRCSDGADAGLFLSGGIDSRLLLTLLPGNVRAITFTNNGTQSNERLRTMQALNITGAPFIELPREIDQTVAMARASADITEGQMGFVSCRTVRFFDALLRRGIRASLTGMFFNQALKNYFRPPPLPDYDEQPMPELVWRRRKARLLAETGLVRRANHLDLLSLVLTDDMNDMLAVARERQVRRLTQWVANGGSFADQADRFLYDNVQFGGTIAALLRTNQTCLVDRSPMYDNTLIDFALGVPSDWKRGGRLVRRALRLSNRALSRIPDSNTGIWAGLSPFWQAVVGSPQAVSRAIGRSLARHFKALEAMRWRHAQNVFNQGAYHNTNALLKVCPSYRELLEFSIEHLPSGCFDIDRIRQLLQDDLSSDRPRLAKLFEAVIALGVFNAKWGPGTSRNTDGCMFAGTETPTADPAIERKSSTRSSAAA